MKKLSVIITSLLLSICLFGCSGGVKDKLKGTWRREFDALGVKVAEEYVFDTSGDSVGIDFYLNGELSSHNNGKYEIKDSKIIITYEKGETTDIDYSINNGVLEMKMVSETGNEFPIVKVK